MSNSYTYVDTDYIYTDPQTGVLRNIGNITDNEALQFAEAGATARRSQELWMNPIQVTGSETLFSIHHYLFQDIYEWAGQKRTVEISKGGKQFFPQMQTHIYESVLMQSLWLLNLTHISVLQSVLAQHSQYPPGTSPPLNP